MIRFFEARTSLKPLVPRGKNVGFYSQAIFPRLCNFSLDRPFIADQRRNLLQAVAGNVLEIGFGTGLNLDHYPAGVSKITAVDPSRGMAQLARARIKTSGIDVDLHILSGEQLPFAEKTFDCVISTFSLCSIPDASQALAEVHRVLAPDGNFLFLEHGLSPDAGVQKWQRRLNWLQMLVGDGCRLDRNIGALVTSQPFSTVHCDPFYLEQTPQTHGYMYCGTATK